MATSVPGTLKWFCATNAKRKCDYETTGAFGVLWMLCVWWEATWEERFHTDLVHFHRLWQLICTPFWPAVLFLPDPVLSSVVSPQGTSVNRQAGRRCWCDSAVVQKLPGVSKRGRAAQKTDRRNTGWQLTAVEEYGSLAAAILYQWSKK